MKSSLFLIDLAKLEIKDIRSFCNQLIPESIRIEYKEKIIDNFKLAKTICAFANTQGGIILVGIKADKNKNVPEAIPGIELKEGLEERIINICISHISPSITPEVKVVDFEPDSMESKSKHVVLIIRIRPSYNPPHYLLKNNEIPIRVHCRTSLADLQTIEGLIKKREDLTSGNSLRYPYYNTREIEIKDVPIETVVVVPRYINPQSDPIIHYYTKEKSDWLFRNANEVMRLSEQRPDQWKLTFVKLNQERQITRYCSIRKDGEIVFQRTASVNKQNFYPLRSLRFVNEVMKNSKKVFSKFGFFNDLSIGLSIDFNEPKLICLPDHILYDNYESKNNKIRVFKNISFDELTNPSKLFEELLKEICILFSLILHEKTISSLIKNLLDI